MFESNPETQNSFGKFQGIDLVQLEASIELVDHGKRVMRIVSLTIENLDHYQQLWRGLIRLGRDHFGMMNSFTFFIDTTSGKSLLELWVTTFLPD